MTAVPPAHRTLRLAGAVAGVGVRSVLLPRHAHRRRGRAQVCGAARILTALGVRVRVVSPDVAWPRTGGLLAVSGTPSWVDRLAVLTAVPGPSTAGRSSPRRPCPGAPPGSTSGRARRAPCCCRCPSRPPAETAPAPWPTERVPRDLPGVLGTHGLVVEVHLLPALDAGAVVPLATGTP